MTDARADRAIDRLDEALRAAGLEPLAPPADPTAVDEVDAALAPYSLPFDVRRFWQRVEFDSLAVSGWTLPEPCGPRSALAAHRAAQEPAFATLYGPPLLFPIASHGGDVWSIELASRWGPGGPIFSIPIGGFGFEYPSLADMLVTYAELLEQGRFERDGPRGLLRLEDERELQRARLRAAPVGPEYGDPRAIRQDPATWPRHWLEAAGIDLDDRRPLGATHTVAEVLSAPVAAGRIAGEVVGLGGSAAGAVATVDDGTGAIDVWCPAGTSPWGPVHRRRFEFEIEVGDAVVASAVRPLE